MLPPALGGLEFSRAAGPGPLRTREYGKDQKSDRDVSTSCGLESFDLVAQRVHRLTLKEIAFTPLRVVERVAIEEHTAKQQQKKFSCHLPILSSCFRFRIHDFPMARLLVTLTADDLQSD